MEKPLFVDLGDADAACLAGGARSFAFTGPLGAQITGTVVVTSQAIVISGQRAVTASPSTAVAIIPFSFVIPRIFGFVPA